MPYCRNCGKAVEENYNFCPYCGVPQVSSMTNPAISSREVSANLAVAQVAVPNDSNLSPEAQAMREVFEQYGAQKVLGNATLLFNALGDKLGEEGRKLRNQVRMVMDAGVGQLYLAQLQNPAPDFDKRVLALLQEEAELGESTARQLRDLFHSMVGFPIPSLEVTRPEPIRVQSVPVAQRSPANQPVFRDESRRSGSPQPIFRDESRRDRFSQPIFRDESRSDGRQSNSSQQSNKRTLQRLFQDESHPGF